MDAQELIRLGEGWTMRPARSVLDVVPLAVPLLFALLALTAR